MILDMPMILVALICISPTFIVMALFYIVLVEAEARREEAHAKKERNFIESILVKNVSVYGAVLGHVCEFSGC